MTATAEIPPTRAEINRRNAQRSTGPRSQAGKERSRFNALKHGCRARLPILPGEDPEAYQDRLDAWIDKFRPRDAVEPYLVERAVHASWQLDRADRAEVAAMVEAADEQALRRARDVLELGATLFHAPHARRRPRRRPRRRRRRAGPLLSWPFDPEHPRHPARLVAELEATAAGCTWLLQRWAALGEILDGGRTWRAVDRVRAIRLLGKQPLDAVADETVLSIYLACQAMDPHGPDVFAEPLSDLRRPETEAAYQRQAERFAAARAERSPRDAAAGRAALRAIVSAAVARVEALREDRAAAERRRPACRTSRPGCRTAPRRRWIGCGSTRRGAAGRCAGRSRSCARSAAISATTCRLFPIRCPSSVVRRWGVSWSKGPISWRRSRSRRPSTSTPGTCRPKPSPSSSPSP